jgi:hypothetical protein
MANAVMVVAQLVTASKRQNSRYDRITVALVLLKIGVTSRVLGNVAVFVDRRTLDRQS